MNSYDEALHQVIEHVAALPPVELALEEAAGHVLAEPAAARWDMPRFDNSAMDGFAIAGIPETIALDLTITGASYAGHLYCGEVQPGQAVRIATGAALPRGADTVVPIEEVEVRDDRIALRTMPEKGQHVRCRGEEYRHNHILVEAGAPLRAGELALLASAGVERVRVFPKPRVAVISTGDELVELGREPGPGQIVNSNLYLLRARLLECGCIPVSIGIGVDDRRALDRLISQALEADAVISTGGVSVGEKDHVKAALAERDFQRIFWKVAIKPGKPVLFGLLEGKPYFGLPGNPAATAATFELFVKPALRRLAGHAEVLPEKRRAVLANEVTGGGSRQTFFWGRLEWRTQGYFVTAQPQGSGQNRGLRAANAIFSLPVGTKHLAVGEDVEVLLLNQ